VAKESATEKLAELERKIEALERENERLRRLLEGRCGPGSDKRRSFRDRDPRLIRKSPDAKQANNMGADIAGPSPNASTRS
jgi:hypothetical protein